MSEKILIIQNEMTPYRLYLFNELYKKNIDFDVFFLSEISQKRSWLIEKGKILFTYRVFPSFKILGQKINSSIFFALYKNRNNVFLIGEGELENALTVLLIFSILSILRSRIIFWSGYIETEYHSRKKRIVRHILSIIKTRFRKLYVNQASQIFAYSEETKRIFSKYKKSNLIYTGGQIIEPINVNFTRKKNKFTIFTLTNFEERKGIPWLIKAFVSIKDPDMQLIIGGKGKPTDENKIKKMSQNDRRIKLVGYVEGEKKNNLFKMSSLFILPSLHDIWGLVVNEAMYFGLPIIISDSCGSKELVQDNGFIVRTLDEQMLKNKIIKLKEDKKLYNDMANNSLRIIKQYDEKKGINALVSCLEGA